MSNHKTSNQKKQVCFPASAYAAALLVLCLLAAGCASKNVNPARARANTGYVDFYAAGEPLSWQIERIKDDGKARQILAQYEPITEPVRLAFAPGWHRLRINFLNHVITYPGLVEVEVRDGLITPVQVTLVQTGTTRLSTRETRARGTYYGRVGRGTRLNLNEADMFRVTAEPQTAVPYQARNQMPYAGEIP